MTQDEFWDRVQEVFLAHLYSHNPDPYNNNRWRWGQTCMNVLRSDAGRTDLYDAITGTDRDPWNVDVSTATYARFVNYIEENW